MCAICLDSVGTNGRSATLACNHAYCQECIEPWLGQRAKCPTCRATISDYALSDGTKRQVQQSVVNTTNELEALWALQLAFNREASAQIREAEELENQRVVDEAGSVVVNDERVRPSSEWRGRAERVENRSRNREHQQRNE